MASYTQPELRQSEKRRVDGFRPRRMISRRLETGPELPPDPVASFVPDYAKSVFASRINCAMGRPFGQALSADA
jgi:hypothetical protein